VATGGSRPRVQAPARGNGCRSEARLEPKGFDGTAIQLSTEAVQEGSGSGSAELRWVDGDGRVARRLGWSSTRQRRDRH
jgi:hypothetical protein